jgi:hypothetical protein
MTIWPKHASSLLRIKNELKNSVAAGAIVSMTANDFLMSGGIYNYGWTNALSL